MPQKPTINKLEERSTIILEYLKTQNYVTKEMMCTHLYWKYTKSNERRIREIISHIASYEPVIAVSDNVGYKLARTCQDCEKVVHQWRELNSRVEELNKRIPSLERFLNSHNFNTSPLNKHS